MSNTIQIAPGDQSSIFLLRMLRSKYTSVLVLVLILCALVVMRFDPRLEYQWDDSSYVIAAKAYLQGQGFVYANDPLMPAAIERPLGVPILITLVFSVFGIDNIVAVKVLICCFYFLLCFGMYTWMRRQAYLSASMAFWLLLVFGSSRLAIDFSHQVMAEIPYTLCSLVALVCAIRSVELLDQRSANRYLWLGGAAILSVIAIYLRSIGLSIVVSIMFYLALHKAFRQLTLYVVSTLALFFGMIALLGSTAGNPFGGYNFTANTDGRIGVALINAWGYSLSLGNLIWPLIFDVLGHAGLQQTLLGALLLATIKLGFLLIIIIGLGSLWRLNKLFVLYGFAYMGVLSLWPYFDAGRFLLPVLPLFLLCFVLGCEYFLGLGFKAVYSVIGQERWSMPHAKTVLSKASNQRVRANHLTILALTVLTASNIFFQLWQARVNHDNIVANWALQGNPSSYAAGMDEYFSAAVWVKNNLPPQLVIATRSPYDFYLWSDHQSIEFGWNGDGSTSIQHALDRSDIVVVDEYWSQTEQLLKPVILQSSQRFQLIYTTTGQRPTRVYKIIQPAHRPLSRSRSYPQIT